MDTGHPLSLLIYVTFAAVVLVVAFMLVKFLRKPGNRHPMAGQRERNIEEIREEGGNP